MFYVHMKKECEFGFVDFRVAYITIMFFRFVFSQFLFCFPLSAIERPLLKCPTMIADLFTYKSC